MIWAAGTGGQALRKAAAAGACGLSGSQISRPTNTKLETQKPNCFIHSLGPRSREQKRGAPDNVQDFQDRSKPEI